MINLSNSPKFISKAPNVRRMAPAFVVAKRKAPAFHIICKCNYFCERKTKPPIQKCIGGLYHVVIQLLHIPLFAGIN